MRTHISRARPSLVAALALTVAAALGAGRAGAQDATPVVRGGVRALSLDEAVRIASQQSEAVQVARAGVTRAEGQVLQARSQRLPQLSGTAGYTRTLKSQFSALAGTAAPPPDSRIPRPIAGLGADSAARCVNYLPAAGTSASAQQLAQYAACSTAFGGGGLDFSKAGFGAANQYSVGLAGSIPLYSGGRIGAQNNVATAGRRLAEAELRAQRAQLTLDVTQTYFDAALADRLLTVADSSLVQTEEVLRQARLARQVGNQSEFELLRAQVTRDNQVPLLLQRRTDRDLAYFRLKQLLNFSLDDSLALTTTLPDAPPAATGATPVSLPRRSAVSNAAADTVPVDDRAPVRQAAEAVRAQEELLRVARSEYLPSLSLSSSYGRVAFPKSGLPSSLNDFASNWTVTVGASLPIYTGGRVRGDNMVARGNLEEARARLQQTREYAAVDSRLALAQLDQAEVAFAASAGTAQQATRAYTIAQVRFREGISTQTELADSRILLEQSAANRALASRNLEVARVRLRLLRDLPLQSASASQGISQGAPTGASQQSGAAGGSAGAARGASSSTFTSTNAAGGQSAASLGGQPPAGGTNTTQGTGGVTP